MFFGDCDGFMLFFFKSKVCLWLAFPENLTSGKLSYCGCRNYIAPAVPILLGDHDCTHMRKVASGRIFFAVSGALIPKHLRESKIRPWSTKTRDAFAPERPLLLLGIAPEFVSCIKSMLIGCLVTCLDS